MSQPCKQIKIWIHCTLVDGRVKSLSPRKNSDIKNGVQIKSVVQEKRHLKDDDVEILKKVKYYQMEMKYLSSQAECKRLKLELAKAQRKNKEYVKNNTDLLSSETLQKENTDEDALHIDLSSDKDNSVLKQNSSVEEVIENMAVEMGNDSHQVNQETTEDKTTDVPTVEIMQPSNQSDTDSGDSNHADDICADTGDSNCGDNSLADSGDSNNSDIINSSQKEDQANHGLDNQNISYNLTDVNCDIESDGGSNLETQQETLSKEFQNINTLENKSKNYNPCDQTDSNEESTNINNSDILNKSVENEFEKFDDESMDTSEIENPKDEMEVKQTLNDSEVANQFEVHESSDKQVLMSDVETSALSCNLDNKDYRVGHDEFCLQKSLNGEEESMDLDDENNVMLDSEKINQPCDKTQFQETLKELEFQYGREESPDIYTMIRTSVLRSLYDDMKILCEENKKLYEKLQKCRSEEQSCETDELHF